MNKLFFMGFLVATSIFNLGAMGKRERSTTMVTIPFNQYITLCTWLYREERTAAKIMRAPEAGKVEKFPIEGGDLMGDDCRERLQRVNVLRYMLHQGHLII